MYDSTACRGANHLGLYRRPNRARVRVVQIGLVGAGLSVLTLEHAQTFSTFAALLMVYGALSAAILPQVETITVDALGDEPKRYGEVRLWGSVGFVLSVVATGYLVERFWATLANRYRCGLPSIHACNLSVLSKTGPSTLA